MTDGIVVDDGTRTARPLLHHTFDHAWWLHAGGPSYCERHGIDPADGPIPLVAYLIIPTAHVVATELAVVRLIRGSAFWLPQTRVPLQAWLERQDGRVTLHREPSNLAQQLRLRWRLSRE